MKLKHVSKFHTDLHTEHKFVYLSILKIHKHGKLLNTMLLCLCHGFRLYFYKDLQQLISNAPLKVHKNCIIKNHLFKNHSLDSRNFSMKKWWKTGWRLRQICRYLCNFVFKLSPLTWLISILHWRTDQSLGRYLWCAPKPWKKGLRWSRIIYF